MKNRLAPSRIPTGSSAHWAHGCRGSRKRSVAIRWSDKMSLLTHTSTAVPVILHRAAATMAINPTAFASLGPSHVAMIRRFGKSLLAIGLMLLAVSAVAGLKVAIFVPNLLH